MEVVLAMQSIVLGQRARLVVLLRLVQQHFSFVAFVSVWAPVQAVVAVAVAIAVVPAVLPSPFCMDSLCD